MRKLNWKDADATAQARRAIQRVLSGQQQQGSKKRKPTKSTSLEQVVQQGQPVQPAEPFAVLTELGPLKFKLQPSMPTSMNTSQPNFVEYAQSAGAQGWPTKQRPVLETPTLLFEDFVSPL
jgi:hypothetical protein